MSVCVSWNNKKYLIRLTHGAIMGKKNVKQLHTISIALTSL